MSTIQCLSRSAAAAGAFPGDRSGLCARPGVDFRLRPGRRSGAVHGLLIGAIAPKAAPPAMVGTLGLLMFLYGVGIQYGRQFFAGLAGPGLAWNALGLVGVIASLVVALQAGAMLGLSVPLWVGLFAGSGTSTPTLPGGVGERRSMPMQGHRIQRLLPVRSDRSRNPGHLPCHHHPEDRQNRATCAGPAVR